MAIVFTILNCPRGQKGFEMNKEKLNEQRVKQEGLIQSLANQQTVLHKSRVDVYSLLSEGYLYEVHVETENYSNTREELNCSPNVVGVWHVPSILGRLERLTNPQEVTLIANELMYELYEITPYVATDFGLQLDEPESGDQDAADDMKEREFLND